MPDRCPLCFGYEDMLVVWARRIEDERRYRHLSRLGCCHVTMPCPLCTEPLEREP